MEILTSNLVIQEEIKNYGLIRLKREELTSFISTATAERPAATDTQFIQTICHSLWEHFNSQFIWMAETVPLRFCRNGLEDLHKLITQAYLSVNLLDKFQLTEQQQDRLFLQMSLPKRHAGAGLTNIALLAPTFRMATLISALPYAAEAYPNSFPVLPELNEICNEFLLQTQSLNLDIQTIDYIETLIGSK